jgi:hypothetical protein
VGELASKLVQPSAEPRPELRREPSTVWQPPKQKVGLVASDVLYLIINIMNPDPYLLVTCRDVSSPPCRRVADVSRHLCGWPSSCCFISVSPCGFPPVLLFTFIFHYMSLIVLVLCCADIFHFVSPTEFSCQSHFSFLYHIWHTGLFILIF